MEVLARSHEYSKDELIGKKYTPELAAEVPYGVVVNIEGKIIEVFEGRRCHKMEEFITK